ERRSDCEKAGPAGLVEGEGYLAVDIRPLKHSVIDLVGVAGRDEHANRSVPESEDHRGSVCGRRPSWRIDPPEVDVLREASVEEPSEDERVVRDDEVSIDRETISHAGIVPTRARHSKVHHSPKAL